MNPIKLNVPLTIQSVDSYECVLACSKMIFEYYGFNLSMDKLRRDVKVFENIGIYAPQIGSYFIKNGFDVTIVTMHPGMFVANDIKRKFDIMERLNSLKKKYSKNKQRIIVLSYFEKYLKDGGKIKIKIPDEKDVASELKNKRPFISFMTTNFILGDAPRFNMHANVITGIDNKFIYVNDPSWLKNLQGKLKYPKKEFFYAIYSTAFADLDNACLILIKKK